MCLFRASLITPQFLSSPLKIWVQINILYKWDKVHRYLNISHLILILFVLLLILTTRSTTVLLCFYYVIVVKRRCFGDLPQENHVLTLVSCLTNYSIVSCFSFNNFSSNLYFVSGYKWQNLQALQNKPCSFESVHTVASYSYNKTYRGITVFVMCYCGKDMLFWTFTAVMFCTKQIKK